MSEALDNSMTTKSVAASVKDARAPDAAPLPPVVISVRNVTKNYKIYDNFITGPLKERLLFWKSENYFTRFAALRDVSLEVRRGQVVGIVGPNGSGKTTLLKSIAGLLSIDKGSIDVAGKVTALLSHGVGVHPEFSGRENIYFGALMLGMDREEINRKIDDIISFSELADYIDRPFRTYSAGMRARLLFSISMAIEPEILIIDEALAAGDAYFVRKCRRRIHDICKSGATVIFVSHDPTQVEELCDHGVFMVGGQIVAQGSPSDMVRQYYAWTFEKEKGIVAPQHESELTMISGSGDAILEKVTLLDKNGDINTGFYAGEPMTIRMHYKCTAGPLPQVGVMCGILLQPQNQYVAELESSWHVDPQTRTERQSMFDLDGRGYIDLRVDPMLLINNTYSLWIKLYTNRDGFKVLCEYRNVAPFFSSRKAHSLSRGPLFWMPFSINVKKES
ncbi:MAG: ABC transporter ATP-binding protein [Rhizobiales bacterium]|nr:ABC transporter ATP-binding protein [Hyphomicrobiales bacterium]